MVEGDKLTDTELENTIRAQALVEGCSSIDWLKEVYKQWSDSSLAKDAMNEDNIKICTPETLFVFNPNKLLSDLEEKYIPKLSLYNPCSEFGDDEKLLELTYDILASLQRNYPSLDKELMVNAKEDKSKIKLRLQNNLHKVKIVRLWKNSYLSDSGFVSYSLAEGDLFKDKELLEVIVDKEFNPLFKKFINEDISEDLLRAEIKNIIDRYNIKKGKEGNQKATESELVSYLYTKTRDNPLEFLLNFNSLYETSVKKIKKEKIRKANELEQRKIVERLEQEKKAQSEFNRLTYLITKYGLDIQFMDTRIYIGQFPKAFSELVQHFNLLSTSLERFEAGNDSSRYKEALTYMSRFFDNAKNFKSMIYKGADSNKSDLNKYNIYLYQELINYKVRINGKPRSYKELFQEILKKLEEKIDNYSKIVIESVKE